MEAIKGLAGIVGFLASATGSGSAFTMASSSTQVQSTVNQIFISQGCLCWGHVKIAFIEYYLWVRHCAKSFAYIIFFDPYFNPL